MEFNYQARTKEGEVQVGTIEASSKEAAAALLQKFGLYVTFLEESKEKPFYAKKIRLFGKVSQKEIVLFSRQLSILFKSRVPLLEALRTLANQAKNPLRADLMDIAKEVEGGAPLSQALGRHENLFSIFYINMVKSGEAAGTMSDTLIYLADHSEKDYELTSRIKGAMIYPAFIVGSLVVVGLIMLVYILPKLTAVFKESEQALPIFTQMLINLSEFLKTKGLFVLFLLAIAGFLTRRYLKTKEGKRLFDEMLLKVPVIGNFVKIVNIVRFAENLSTLIAGGLPIGQALEITGNVVGNTFYKEMIVETKEAVRRGETISSVLQKHPFIVPPLLSQMAIVGERTGQLDSTLKNVVDFYQKELQRGIDNILGLIEPVLIVFLGVAIGAFVAAVMLPLYNLGSGSGAGI